MFIYVQMLLALFGGLLVFRGRFRIGSHEIVNPYASMTGIALVSQLLISILLWFVCTVGTVSVQDPFATPDPDAPAPQAPAQAPVGYPEWIDMAVTSLFVLGAGIITYLGITSEDQDPFAGWKPKPGGRLPREFPSEGDGEFPIESPGKAPPTTPDGAIKRSDSWAV